MPRLCTNAYVQASKAIGFEGPRLAVPAMDEVLAAVREQNITALLRWYRFCYGPGETAIGTPEFEEKLAQEAPIIKAIVDGTNTVRRIIEAADED